MSKIQIAELRETSSKLNILNAQETSTVVGGYDYNSGYRREVRNAYIGDINIITQVINNINIQIAFGGDNFNVANLSNTAGVDS